MSILSIISAAKDGLKKAYKLFKERLIDGYNWIGTSGIINMESSALLVMVLVLFFPMFWAALITFICVITKCTLDKKRGSEHEKHDFICALLGISFGLILNLGHAAVLLI